MITKHGARKKLHIARKSTPFHSLPLHPTYPYNQNPPSSPSPHSPPSPSSSSSPPSSPKPPSGPTRTSGRRFLMASLVDLRGAVRWLAG
ncbi:unnamed protein product [Closterium sp. NIES-54]